MPINKIDDFLSLLNSTGKLGTKGRNMFARRGNWEKLNFCLVMGAVCLVCISGIAS